MIFFGVIFPFCCPQYLILIGRRYTISGGLFFLCKYMIKNQKDNPYVSGFSLYPQQPVSHKAKSIHVMNRMGFIIRMSFYCFK